MVYPAILINRVSLLLCLDTAMLVLLCVLECLALTGLDVHVWLGFALCPLVLVHVVMQWQWFVTQFQRIRATRAYRVRVNALLNLGLLFMMSAVLGDDASGRTRAKAKRTRRRRGRG